MKDQKPPSGSLLETTRLITDAVNDIRLGLQWNDDEGDCLISKAADRLEMHARTLRILAGSEKRLAAKPIHQVLSEEPPSTAWKVMAVKVPEHLHAAIVRESGGDVAQFVRQTLAARLGVEYAERLPGLASAKPATRKRVSSAGVKARRTNLDTAKRSE